MNVVVPPQVNATIEVAGLLPSGFGLYRVRTDSYPVSRDFKDVTLTLPRVLYKVGLISFLHLDYVVHQTWITSEMQEHGLFVSEDSVSLPIFVYLDLYGSDFQGIAENVSKEDNGNYGAAPDESGAIFSSLFASPSEGEGATTNPPNRFLAKVKPSLLGWIKVVDKIQFSNITANINVDISVDSLRSSMP